MIKQFIHDAQKSENACVHKESRALRLNIVLLNNIKVKQSTDRGK